MTASIISVVKISITGIRNCKKMDYVQGLIKKNEKTVVTTRKFVNMKKA